MPADPDWDYVPEELALLAHLSGGRVTLIDEDGVGPAVLVIAPGLWGHSARLDGE